MEPFTPADLASSRASQDWDRLEKRYFSAITFFDIREDPATYRRKRRARQDSIYATRYSSVGFIDRLNRLVRLDVPAKYTVPTETFIYYDEQGLAAQALTFITGRRLWESDRKSHMVDYEHLKDEYLYAHDASGRIAALMWIQHYDPVADYRPSDHWTHHYDYQHDEHGLLYRYLRDHGEIAGHKSWSNERRLVYDRLFEEYVRSKTISPYAWIPRDEPNPRTKLSLRFGGESSSAESAPTCPSCGQPMTFVFELAMAGSLKRLHQLAAVPVHYCFGCRLKSVTATYPLPSSATLDAPSDRFPPRNVELWQLHYHLTHHDKPVTMQIGGAPFGERMPEHPICPECGKQMPFVGRIDSDPSVQSASGPLIFAQAGSLLTFACCNSVTSLVADR